MTDLAYIWIRFLSWLLLSWLHYLWQKDLRKKSWEMGHSLVFLMISEVERCEVLVFWWSLHSDEPKVKTHPLEQYQVCNVFSSSKILFVMWVCFSPLCLKASVLFDTALYAVDIALCGLQNSSEPMF